jgi:peptidoglycan-N-acetylglucosamine deacetylase
VSADSSVLTSSSTAGVLTPPIFYDPHQRRWRWFTRLLQAFGLVASLAAVAVTAAVLVNPVLPGLGLPPVAPLPQAHRLLPPRPERLARLGERRFERAKHALRVEKARAVKPGPIAPPAPHPTELYAFFVNWDDTSFTSLKKNIGSIDVLVPEWLHLADETGRLVENNPPRRQLVMNFIKAERPDLRVLPLVNNFNTQTLDWQSERIGKMLADPAARAHTISGIGEFLTRNHFPGVNVDFEGVPRTRRSELVKFMCELKASFEPHGWTISESVPLDDPAFDYKGLSECTDRLVLMAYDEHTGESDPGPVASQTWFTDGIARRLADIPPGHAVAAIGNYGYDWIDGTSGHGSQVSFQEAMRIALESEGHAALDEESLTPTFDYGDEHQRLHHVWFLDAISAFNQLQAARHLNLAGVALWRLGSEDPSVWTVFQRRSQLDGATARLLQKLQYGYDLDYEGEGEVLQVTATPRTGARAVGFDASRELIVSERFDQYPSAYVIERRGRGVGKQVVLSFDDGPDPQFTPKILDILRDKGVKAVFFVIGLNADLHPGLLERIVHEGHEIGNHSFTHPDISAISPRQFRLELNATERLFEARLGRGSLLFRPPYAEDVEPETPDQVDPLVFTSERGYYTIGIGIDPGDWRNPGVDQIVESTLEGAANGLGHVVLLHDSGGDRRETIAALPRIIDGLRDEGFEIVPISRLLGVSPHVVMPPVPSGQRGLLLMADAGFLALGAVNGVLQVLFVVGLALGCLRLLVIATLAIGQRVRRRRHVVAPDVSVAVIVPAYNESKVIERTIRSLLASDGRPFEIIVVDDGSVDGTYALVKDVFAGESRVRVFTRPNGGKSAALNFGLRQTDADIVVALDADTLFEPQTIPRLTARFSDPRVAAVAGNAKVGNRLNLLTRWQALEYITSQNLDRRAFDALNCITVVPGAVGAWRRQLILEAGGFSHDTLAEDADLTLTILRSGRRVAYDDGAIAWTEAPDTTSALLKQRFRWMYGTLQATWKQRDAIFRPRFGSLGLVALPNLLLFQVIFPLISPVMDLELLVSGVAAFTQSLQHPTEFSPDTFSRTLFYYAVFILVDALAALLGFLLEEKEDWALMLWLPLQRFWYRQLMYYVAVKSTLTAIRGSAVGWGKLERKATVVGAHAPSS